jgi:Mn-dependent DtxR family transcriptional regulator
MTEEVTVNDIAALLEVSRKSAIQRMSDLLRRTKQSNLTCQR